MDKDKVVTEDNYKQVVLKRMITLCWVLLGICFVVKIFGGNFFAFVGESAIVEFICDRIYLLIPFQSMFYIFGTYLFYLTVTNHKHKILSFIIVLIMNTMKQLIKLGSIWIYVTFVCEFVGMFLIPIFALKRKWYNVVYINLLLIIFQIVSLITKNIVPTEFPRADVVSCVYMIDYYIMVTLMFLYSRIKEINIVEWGLWFLSTKVTQLQAYKGVLEDRHEKKIAKENAKYEKKVAKVDAKIEKINKKK